MKRPAFQFYPADFLVGTMRFSDAEVGIYIKMLCFQWEHGALPDSGKAIKKLVNSSKIPSKIVLEKFEKTESGMIANKRLEMIRSKQQEYSESRSRAAEARWNTPPKDDAYASDVHPVCTVENHALQSSSSISSNEEKKRRVAYPPVLTPPFQSEAFMDAWLQWETHRKELRKPLMPTSIKLQYAKLGKYPESTAIEALLTAAERGWTGLRPQDVGKDQNGPKAQPSQPKGYFPIA